MELIPYTLAKNAGFSPFETVTELRRQHANGNKDFGINVRKGAVANIKEENVLQPLLVTSYAIEQASETVRKILKIDDIIIEPPKTTMPKIKRKIDSNIFLKIYGFDERQ
uniref:Uncharacterized protein n=1 Tax=Panagrolaimus davidi TaxID=227884 RepID=A0A914RE08_9BILA